MLRKDVHERLATEFRIAADAVRASGDISSKIYFFSVFYGESQRQINTQWDADLNLLYTVVRTALQEMQSRSQLPTLPGAVEGLPVGYFEALDEISEELATIFEGDEIDRLRFYGALGRVGELGYAVTGNGYYLYLKGMIRIAAPNEPQQPSSQSRDAAQESDSQPLPSRPSSPGRRRQGS